MNNLSVHVELFNFSIAVIVSSCGFIFCNFFPESELIKKWFNFQRGEKSDVLFRRLLGVFIYGFVPLLILFFSGAQNLANIGINPITLESGIWTIVLSIVVLPVTYLNSRRADNLKIYPQIREGKWSFPLVGISAVSWIAYLFSYEFLFRGFLFFASLPLLGLWPSIILNTSIYTLIHLPKGFKEVLGTIPFGILLCYLTYVTNSIWLAVFTHIVMALSGEWFSLRAHPEISVKRTWK